MNFLNTIESKNNFQVKEIRKLRNKKYRTNKGVFLVEGFRFVDEALESEFNVCEIFIDEDASGRWKRYVEGKNIEIFKNIKSYFTSHSVFKTISNTGNSQGVIAVVRNIQLKVKSQDGFYVLADRIQDPGNMGTIIRSAHASGALGVITTKGTVDIYNEKTLRSTMGSIFHIPVFYDFTLDGIELLKKDGFKVVASVLDAKTNFYDVNLKDRIILAVGNEGNGLSNQVNSIADIKVKIPMPGGTESLNASVAVSIMMFEIVRQKLI